MFHHPTCKMSKVLYHSDEVYKDKYLCLVSYAGNETGGTAFWVPNVYKSSREKIRLQS